MPDEIDIRRLTRNDAAVYREIRLAALKTAPEAFGSTYAAETERTMEAFAQRLETSTVFAAYLGDRIVGMAGFRQQDGAKDAHKADLWGCYVEPEARRRGVGDALIVAVLKHATGRVEQILLSVVSENRAARGLYERHDFTVYGTEPRALKTGADYSDEVLMVRFL
jgi:ribosomal protein S18 acetylase RimI-like enzyme